MIAAEPAPTPSGPGEPVSAALIAEALSDLHRWAPRRLAVMLGGSAACGEMVWFRHAGRLVTLSDLDVYAVTPDARSRDGARRRARADLPEARARIRSLGLEAPLEVAFFTPRDLESLPARPATIELRRAGRVLEGDPAWRERVPGWRPADVSREERLLLLENRGFELLWARARLAADGLVRLQARHAVLKAALDLAGARCLAAGEYPQGATARVARARALAGGAHPAALEASWEAALGWRLGRVEALPPGDAVAEWSGVAAAWCEAWRATAGDADPHDAASLVRHAARRAPLRRRLRRALDHADRSGRGPGLAHRIAHAGAGTPQHRVNASGVLLVAALRRAGSPENAAGDAPDPALRAALSALGVVRAEGGVTLGRLAARCVRAWDDWLLDGQRVEEEA